MDLFPKKNLKLNAPPLSLLFSSSAGYMYLSIIYWQFFVGRFIPETKRLQRTLRLRHFDVQILGGIALHEGQIAEMATGEGKTLVAILPAFLNALTGGPRFKWWLQW